MDVIECASANKRLHVQACRTVACQSASDILGEKQFSIPAVGSETSLA